MSRGRNPRMYSAVRAVFAPRRNKRRAFQPLRIARIQNAQLQTVDYSEGIMLFSRFRCSALGFGFSSTTSGSGIQALTWSLLGATYTWTRRHQHRVSTELTSASQREG
ncbi:hypothetical protein BJX64DRAFT_261515 [Aspergillus heterothallicus]